MNSDPRLEFLESVAPGSAPQIAALLDTTAVTIRTSVDSARLALSLANIVGRLLPNVRVQAPRNPTVSLPVFGAGTITELAEQTLQQVRLSSAAATLDEITVDVGLGSDDADIYVAASRWSLQVGTEPVGKLSGTGPATTAASALAAAEVLRRVVPALPGVRLSSMFEWNLLDFTTRVIDSDPSPDAVEAVCFGGGSVGSSLVYALLLGDASGLLTVVDPDRLTSRNRIRYPMWVTNDAGAKAAWLEQAARGSRLHVRGEQTSAAQYLLGHEQPIMTAVAAVDSAAARRDIADALARVTINAGVDGMQFHVSRHGYGDGQACVYCGYLDAGDPLDESGVYSDMTGLPLHRVRVLLSGETLREADVDLLLQSGRLSEGDRRDFVGARLQDIARLHIYAQAVARSPEGSVAIAAPFVSALAGALLAAELQKGPTLAAWRLDRRVDVDCTGYPTGLVSRMPQDSSGRCLCADRFRLRAYQEIWG